MATNRGNCELNHQPWGLWATALPTELLLSHDGNRLSSILFGQIMKTNDVYDVNLSKLDKFRLSYLANRFILKSEDAGSGEHLFLCKF